MHRLGGQQPPRSVNVRFYRGDPATGGEPLGQATAPLLSPNSHGSTAPVSWTPDAAGAVDIYAVIDPDDLVAESDETNNLVSRPATVLSPQADTMPPVVNSLAINDGALTTSSRDVMLDVVASDSGAPSSGVAGVYIVEYVLNLDLGIWAPQKTSDGWIDYTAVTASGAQPDASNVAYPWQLTDRRGIRYLQVWVVDRVGNISPQPKRSYINYVPATLQVDANVPQILRYELRQGDSMTIRVQPLSGDPDIYLWAPDALTLPRAPWYSNGNGAQMDQLNVVAPITGAYQLEIAGEATAEFTLEVQITPAAVVREGSDANHAVDPAKPVRTVPFVPPTALPGDRFSLTPPTAEQPENRLFLPAVQR